MIKSPFVLLLVTGAALGCNFPLGKLATARGIDPLLWAAYISSAAGLVMLLISAVGGRLHAPRGRLLKFSLASGVLSYVVPNGLTYVLIPKMGAGLVAIMFALSPVFTALLSIVLRVRPPNLFGVAGIGFGLAGAVVIVAGRGAVSLAGTHWLLIALLIPVFLGMGNVYRTMAWPPGAAPGLLAATTNLAAVPPLLLLAHWHAGGLDLSALGNEPLLLVGQLAASTVMFLTFFRLQQAGGPTYLSQIGYVAAAVGLLAGIVALGETYPWTVWAGAATIATGIALSTWSQRSR